MFQTFQMKMSGDCPDQDRGDLPAGFAAETRSSRVVRSPAGRRIPYRFHALWCRIGVFLTSLIAYLYG